MKKLKTLLIAILLIYLFICAYASILTNRPPLHPFFPNLTPNKQFTH